MDLRMIESKFPPGTPVLLRQWVRRRGHDTVAEVAGVVESWDMMPTGSWYAHGKKHKLWLPRLKLRKEDGEVTLIVVDDATEIARIEPAAA